MARLQSVDMQMQSDTESLDSLQSVLAAIESLLGNSGPVDEARAKQIRKAVDALRNGHDDADPDTGPGPEDRMLQAQIDAGMESLRERVNRQVEQRQRDYDRVLQLMEEVETALAENVLHQAEQSCHKLMSIMGNVADLSGQRWQDIRTRLDNVRPRLRNLESWRHWGTTQVRQELIDQIRGLTVSELPPEQIAGMIREARAQWQALDKSGDHASKELWKEFDALCEKAYKPCTEHFRKLRGQRKENLKQRRAIIDRLNERCAATDWKAPDWRDLDRYTRQARRDFHRIGNVDYRERKAVAKALDEALDKFDQYLSRERERSLRVRERLIADIEALHGMENVREALEQLESLKKQWAITVSGKRSVENRLWKRFQDACEVLYSKRNAERRQHDIERNDHLRQKQALIEELEQAAAAADDVLLASAALPDRIRERWQETGQVPRKLEAPLEKRWRTAQKHFHTALAAAKSRARVAELDVLARRAALCRQWELQTLAGPEVDQQQSSAEWDALPGLSGTTGEAMQQRYKRAFARPDAATLAANLATLEDACLRLEVLLELESPPECQAARMAFQVERLNASLKKELDAQESVEDLLHTALTTGAVAPAAAEAIGQRIQNCLAGYRNRPRT